MTIPGTDPQPARPETTPTQTTPAGTRLPVGAPLSVNLAKAGFLLALGFGLALSVIQVAIEYHSRRDAVGRSIERLVAMFRPSAVEAAFALDEVLARQICAGLMGDPLIARVGLETDHHKQLAAVSRPAENFGPAIDWLTAILFGLDQERRVTLEHARLPGQAIGYLTITLDLRPAVHGLLNQAGLFSLSAVILAVLLASGMILLAFRRLTQPLGALTTVVAAVDPVNPGQVVLTPPPGHERDELGRLVEAVNTLLRSIRAGIEQRDLKEKELQATLERVRLYNQELERFAEVTAHHLQEPLRIIAGYAQLLHQRHGGDLDEDGHEFVGFMLGGCTRMKALLSDLHRYVALNTAELERGRVDSASCLARVEKDLAQRITETAATVATGRLPPVLANTGQVTLLLRSLLANALEYRDPARPPMVTISAAAEGDWEHFTVTDNGIGIEPRFQERIFRIFERLHGQEQHPGTGIGLAICRKIVDRHGGRIWVESTPGAGTVLHFTLPALPATTAGSSGS